MTAFLIRRVLLLVPVLFGVSVVVFLALHLAPGDPAQLLLGPMATPNQLSAMRAELSLNQPLPIQYLRWIGQVLSGNLGFSISYHQGVNSLVISHLINTLWLAMVAFVLATGVGLLLGILGAFYRGSWIDHAINILDFIGLAVPVFWLALLLILFFGLSLRWLPVAGMYQPGAPETLTGVAQHIILPALALAAAPGAVIAQIVRVSMLREIEQPYLRTAKAKGLSHSQVVLRHALRNAWIPVITTLGLEINYIIGGDVLVENVFNWPGVGQLLVVSVLNRDYPVVLGATLILATIFVLVNLLVDALYPLVDPRVSVHG